MGKTQRSVSWRSKNSKIWAMAHECGLSENHLRDIVEGITNERSISALTERTQGQVIEALERHRSQIQAKRRAQKKRISSKKGDQATSRQIGEMRRLAEAMNWGKPALRIWLKKFHGVEREEWLTASRATKVIQGLRSMLERKKSDALQG